MIVMNGSVVNAASIVPVAIACGAEEKGSATVVKLALDM